MIKKVLVVTKLNFLSFSLLHCPMRKHKFSSLFLEHIHLGNYRNCSSNANTDIFDTVQVQKYLTFITSNSYKNGRTKEVEQVVKLLQDKKNAEKEITNLENMDSEGDKELQNLIESEKKQYLETIQQIKNEILFCLMPYNNENDNRNAELQIIPGIGGEEAKLFAKELFQMYTQYADFKNWEFIKDFSNGYILISGEYVFGHLKYEAGVHRVQRVPETEKSGRIHTSTCSVAVLPQPKPYEIKIKEKDLLIEKIKSSGPGGQNVNKRETCIRIKHIPTGIVIENQTSRFQFENLKLATDRLRGVLFNIEQGKIAKEKNILIKEQTGTNDYADKIRTYHYPQNRVTDHRLNYTTQNLRGFLSGSRDLDFVISKMREINKKNSFFSHIDAILNSAEYKNFERQSG